ncbi:MAG: type II toxin-antitoxin system PemK/MazF family toxin [Actinobacteria bacterium]|nr:type II toxin-antitoxin system PemK/MazF family toxin [Actinomycetota bacterium]
MRTARQGEIWLVDFGIPVGHEQGSQRPALVISADGLNLGASGLVVVIPLTTTRRDLPLHVEVELGTNGLDEISYAKCEDIKSISIKRLVHRLGAVDYDVLYHVRRVLNHVLEI